MEVIIDIETERLHDPQIIWCIVCKDVETGKLYEFGGLNKDDWLSDFVSFSKGVTTWIGHNIISFDQPVTERLTGIKMNDVIDTLVLSRLHRAVRINGHSLEAWGGYLNFPKLDFKQFDVYSDEMLKYCINDVELTFMVYDKLIKNFAKHPDGPGAWDEAIQNEHNLQYICEDLTHNGFSFDASKAQKMMDDLDSRLEKLTREIQAAFPPRSTLVREVMPKAKKDGTLSKVGLPKGDIDLTAFTPGCPFDIIEMVPFNPGSPSMVVDRLNEVGWKPTEKTKGHLKLLSEIKRQRIKTTQKQLDRLAVYEKKGWKLSEENLGTLPEDAPEGARSLVEWLLLSSRRSTLKEWMNAYNEDTGSIHGRFMHIGCWSHRMSHNSPNMANIPAIKSRFKNEHLTDLAIHYGGEMRSLWKVENEKNQWLVGTDAEGIQLRIFAHYINDPSFTDALVSGTKEDGTDAHSLTKSKLGDICRSRDNAKTFIYALLLGAGVPRIQQIFQCTEREARHARDSFIEAYPGLKYLKDVVIPKDAQRGYFKGLDGRLIVCQSKHLMLAGYLQSGEKIVMSVANKLWRDRLWAPGLRHRFSGSVKQLNFVHDEWQTQVDGDRSLAELVGEIQSDCIKSAGELLKINCPLSGSYNIGKTWKDTH